MKYKLQKRLWQDTPLTSIYLPVCRKMYKRAEKYIEASASLTFDDASYWPILVDGRHMPLALMEELGGAKGSAYATCEHMQQFAIAIMEQSWKLSWDNEVMEGTIIDINEVDDPEYQQMLDDLDNDLLDNISLFNLIEGKWNTVHQTRWMPSASSLK